MGECQEIVPASVSSPIQRVTPVAVMWGSLSPLGRGALILTSWLGVLSLRRAARRARERSCEVLHSLVKHSLDVLERH